MTDPSIFLINKLSQHKSPLKIQMKIQNFTKNVQLKNLRTSELSLEIIQLCI